jgi:glutaredoxin-related protein
MFKLYTKENCQYCVKAKELLKSKNLDFVEYSVESSENRQMLFEVVPTARSVPQIFDGDEYIGGYENLIERIKLNERSNFLVG